jgi:tryptophan-rich sensory protein
MYGTVKPNYVVLPALSIVAMTTAKTISQQGMVWYKTVSVPWWTPSGWVFSLVWTVIYVNTPLSALVVWNTWRRTKQFTATMSLFAVNLILNSAWVYIFFTKHRIGLALLDALLLGGVVLIQLCCMWPRSRVDAQLLVPYALWGAFAAALNGAVYSMNVA